LTGQSLRVLSFSRNSPKFMPILRSPQVKLWLLAAAAVTNNTVITSDVSVVQTTSVTADRLRADVLLGASTIIW